MRNWPPQVWSLIFIAMGVGVMAISLTVHNATNGAQFLGTGTGLVSAGLLVFQHTASSSNGKDDKPKTDPTEPAAPPAEVQP